MDRLAARDLIDPVHIRHVVAARPAVDDVANRFPDSLLVVAGLVMVVLWSPPLIQEATGHPGNLGEVASYFVNGSRYTSQQAATIAAGPAAGWHTAFGVMGKQLTPPGPWWTGREIDKYGFAASAAPYPVSIAISFDPVLTTIELNTSVIMSFVR